MKEIIYDKLVRDKIPEIIEKSGKQCKIEILSDEKYLEMIDKKLDEELAEYQKDQNIEELADLLEVIYAATKARGYSIEELEKVRVEKVEKQNSIFAKGGYTDKEAERNILSNPFKRFEDMNMMRRTKTLGIVEVDSTVWKKLSEEEKEHILSVCDKKLGEYYDRIK